MRSAFRARTPPAPKICWPAGSPSSPVTPTYRASDVESILLAGAGVAHPSRRGEAIIVALPVVTSRPLSDYAARSLS
jgi:hypothetical protein